MVGSSPQRSAKKNNSKRSTILQHLLAGPHQQMLQNSSALEIKGSVVRQRCTGWELVEEMVALEASCSPRLIAYEERRKMEGVPLFFRFIPHKYCIFFSLVVPSVKIITQTQHKAFIAPPLRRHCPYFAYQHNGASLLLFSHIIKFITLHLWQIETPFFFSSRNMTRFTSKQNKKSQKH